MHPQTYDVKSFQTTEGATGEGYTVPLTEAQVAEVLPMNRKQRRAWLAEQRRAERKGRD